MKRLPTDYEILNAIYERYYDDFASFVGSEPTRSAKIMVPIDVRDLSSDMGVDPDIIFGRLYYHLERRHGYRQDDGSRVHLFALAAGDDRHCINFPLASSVLANLRDENRKYRIVTGIAVVSLVVSVASILISVLG